MNRPATVRKAGTWRSEEAAASHRLAIATGIETIAKQLMELLGRDLATRAVGLTDRKALARYAAGERKPQAETERRMRDAYLVVRLLADYDSPEVVVPWLRGMNPDLGDGSPIDYLHDGDAVSVAQAAEAFLLGG